MRSQAGNDQGSARLLSSQKQYYDLRAPEYLGGKSDRKVLGEMDQAIARRLVAELRPTGAVLEIACGTGMFTRELVRHAASVRALDASPTMLDRARQEVDDPRVTYVEADIFAWQPDRHYDTVFFGFWLSHVPPLAFEAFWTVVRASLTPRGRVAFVDEDDRARGHDEAFLVDGVPAARRTLTGGRQFDIVKVFWEPVPLQKQLRVLDWDVTIQRVGETFMFGVGHDLRS